MKQNANSRRLAEIAREKLANIILFETADPDLQLITVSSVEVSIDKSIVRAYVSTDPERYESVLEALERAKGHIRSLLGRSLGWKVTPELRFEIDTTADEAEKIARALADVPPTLAIEKDEFGYPVEGTADEAEGE